MNHEDYLFYFVGSLWDYSPTIYYDDFLDIFSTTEETKDCFIIENKKTFLNLVEKHILPHFLKNTHPNSGRRAYRQLSSLTMLTEDFIHSHIKNTLSENNKKHIEWLFMHSSDYLISFDEINSHNDTKYVIPFIEELAENYPDVLISYLEKIILRDKEYLNLIAIFEKLSKKHLSLLVETFHQLARNSEKNKIVNDSIVFEEDSLKNAGVHALIECLTTEQLESFIFLHTIQRYCHYAKTKEKIVAVEDKNIYKLVLDCKEVNNKYLMSGVYLSNYVYLLDILVSAMNKHFLDCSILHYHLDGNVASDKYFDISLYKNSVILIETEQDDKALKKMVAQLIEDYFAYNVDIYQHSYGKNIDYDNMPMTWLRSYLLEKKLEEKERKKEHPLYKKHKI